MEDLLCGPPSHALGQEAVLLFRLQEMLCAQVTAGEAPEGSHWREALFLRGVRQVLPVEG